jgi:hypothetical protein
MKLSALFVLFLFSTTAFAHIEEGTWKGMSSVDGEEFLIYHPRTVDTTTGAVSFNHDFFEAVRATSVGSNSLVNEMLHTPAFEGPSAFKWTKHNWRAHALETLDCKGLKHFP